MSARRHRKRSDTDVPVYQVINAYYVRNFIEEHLESRLMLEFFY
ncbi:19584_t:CDS:2 [Entrophospora sp. SA101]|nr:19584_t:CDS:2 [Entrophospora sp. SA101]